jgi:hypothetical protein
MMTDRGTAWIMSIAGINIALTVDDPAVGKEALRFYDSFIVNAEPVVEITIRVRPDMAGGESALIKTESDGIVYRVESHNFSGTLDTSRGVAAFSIAPDWEALDAVLRVVLSILLAKDGGLLIHASSVSMGGNAFIFPARPEGGKSTIAKLLQDDKVIGDELVAVRRDADVFTVYGTPFWNGGPLASRPPVKAPVKAICLLTKADRTSATKLEPVAMAVKMLPHVFCDPENLETNRVTLNALAGMTETISCYELRFALNAEDLRRCLNGIG